MCNLVGKRYAQQGELTRYSRNVRKQPEEVFRIQLLPRKRTRNVDSALDIGSEEGGVYRFGLSTRNSALNLRSLSQWYSLSQLDSCIYLYLILRKDKVIQELLLQLEELFKAEMGC